MNIYDYPKTKWTYELNSHYYLQKWGPNVHFWFSKDERGLMNTYDYPKLTGIYEDLWLPKERRGFEHLWKTKVVYGH